jgi:hypothetical protein
MKEIKLPVWLDKAVWKIWMEDGEILYSKESTEKGNFLVLARWKHDYGDGYIRTNYRLLRFFNLGTSTQVSVDIEQTFTSDRAEKALVEFIQELIERVAR